MQVMRVSGWGLWLHEARYYGWRWCLCIGPFLIFFWNVNTQSDEQKMAIKTGG